MNVKRATSHNVVNFGAYRRQNRAAFFTRQELNQLLGLYAEKSLRGEWRHSSLDQRYGMIAYAVHADPLDHPLYVIAKCDRAHRAKGKYVLISQKRRIKQAHSLAEIILFLKSL
jgi:hypothetical protein